MEQIFMDTVLLTMLGARLSFKKKFPGDIAGLMKSVYNDGHKGR